MPLQLWGAAPCFTFLRDLEHSLHIDICSFFSCVQQGGLAPLPFVCGPPSCRDLLQLLLQ